jgi:hypothetical protein
MAIVINLDNVQPTLVSGTNIKTINSVSLLGSGDIPISLTNFANGNLSLTADRTHDFASKQMTWNNVKQFKLIATVAPPIGEAIFRFQGFGTGVDTDRITSFWGTSLLESHSFRGNGDYRTKGALFFDQTTKGIQILDGSSYSSSIIIGNQNGGFPTVGNTHFKIGRQNTVNNSLTGIYQFGVGNNTNQGGNGLQLGTSNTHTQGASTNNFQLGNQLITNTPSGANFTTINIGLANQLLHEYSMTIGCVQKTTAPNQLLLGHSQSNASIAGFNDIYFGTGVRSANQNLIGSNIVINGSGAGLGTDLAAGKITIAGGRATGSAIGGDFAISTATIGATGTALQALTDRLVVKWNTGDVLAKTGHVEVETVGKGFILKSPNGTRYKIQVDNAGVLSTALA